jgi:hypothetical protein
MTQNQLPPDLKKITVVIGPFVGGCDIEAGSFSVGAHNTASWAVKTESDTLKYYCHLSQISAVVTREEE